MTLPVSGTISFYEINIELDRWPTWELSLDDAELRALAAVPVGEIMLSDLHGKDYVIVDQPDHVHTMDGTRLCTMPGVTLLSNGVPTASFIAINDAGDALIINDAGDKLLFEE